MIVARFHACREVDQIVEITWIVDRDHEMQGCDPVMSAARQARRSAGRCRCRAATAPIKRFSIKPMVLQVPRLPHPDLSKYRMEYSVHFDEQQMLFIFTRTIAYLCSDSHIENKSHLLNLVQGREILCMSSRASGRCN